MKKIRNTNSKILLALSLMFATSALGLISFGTMCAFQNKEQESFQYQTDIKPLSSYFDGGIGTLSNPYIISDEQSFIDFQKLVQLGCFTYNTYFQLGANISFSADTVLDPIGTENCPFNSQFDGMGFQLSNLKVSSVNHEDVGVFGYVGSGAYIKNIILNAPSITSTGPSTKTVNPLEGIMPSSSITTPKYNTTSITMSSREIQGTDSKNYTVYFRSANKGILTDDGVLQTANIKSNNKFAIHVDAIITTSYLINNEPMVVTYVADRFAVYIENKAILSTDGVVSLFDRTTVDGKLTTKDPHYYEDGTTEASTLRVLDNVTYVGLFVGHIDGEASYIGVYNGTITANSRETISHSSIIGKHKDDTLLNSLDNNYYYQDINFSQIIETVPTLYTDVTYVDTHNFNTTTETKHDTDHTTLFDNTQSGLKDIGIQIPKAFRIYNGFGVNPLNSKIVKTYDEDTNTIIDEPMEMEGIYLKENMTEIINYKPITYTTITGKKDAKTVTNYDVDNAIWIFTNSTFLNSQGIWGSILDTLFGEKNIPVYITIKLSYSVSNCTAANAHNTKFTLKAANFSDKNVPAKDNIGFVWGKDYIDQFGDSDYSNVSKTTDASGTEIWNFKSYDDQIAPVQYLDENGNPQTKEFNPLVCSTNSNTTLTGEELKDVILTKTISVQSNSKTNAPLFGKTVTYSPLFILGLDKIEEAGAQVDIYRIELLISFDQGNFSYSLDKVDFLYDLNATYDSSAATWTGWAKKESGVKIYFILQDLEADDTNTNLNTGVVITYTRSSGYGYKVTATYTVLGDNTYVPTNTSGAQRATITDGRTQQP